MNGHSPARLRSVIHLARARCRTEQLRNELVDVSQRFAGRKLVDQARGILMSTRQLRDNEAYRVLRSTAMGAKQRIGQVAQQIITQAHYAEAISRAGQMRMLSQRCMRLYALIVLGGAQAKRPVKQALIAVVTRDPAAIAAVTAQELADGFAFLDVLPLSDTEIAQDQARSRETWAALQDAIARDEIDPA